MKYGASLICTSMATCVILAWSVLQAEPVELLQSIGLRRCEASFGQLPKIHQLPIKGGDYQGLLLVSKKSISSVIVSLSQFDTLMTEMCYPRCRSTRLMTTSEDARHCAQESDEFAVLRHAANCDECRKMRDTALRAKSADSRCDGTQTAMSVASCTTLYTRV